MLRLSVPTAVSFFAGYLAFVVNASIPVVTINGGAVQTITSFGASGAWWPNDLALFPESVQANLSHLLFSEDGLKLSSYRYNVGADGGSDAKNVTRWDAIVQSFLLSNGTYDFSRDAAGVSFMKAAQRYQVPYITFFLNAAPAAIASNHAACGYTLEPAAIPSFVSYIAKVLSYWSENGIDISYISPMNEPDNNRASCTQEGMAVDPLDRPPVFKALRESLDASECTKHIDIIGDETSTLIEADAEYPLFLASAAPYLSNIAIHNYDFPSNAAMSTWYALTKTLTGGKPPPVKFTETCCSTSNGTGLLVFGSQYDPTMVNALVVARYVWQFLTLANAVSFDWWTAVSTLPCSPTLDGAQCATALNNSAGYNDGLVYIDPQYNQTHDYSLYLTKRFWTLRHFSYYIRPGSVRYPVDESQLPVGVQALATRSNSSNDGQSMWQFTFLNALATPLSIQLNLDQTQDYSSERRDRSMPFRLIGITVTNPQHDWLEVDKLSEIAQQTAGSLTNIELSSQSITTVRFTN